MTTVTRSPLLRAVQNLIAALREQDDRISRTEQELKTARAHRSELVSALSTLVRSLPDEERQKFQTIVQEEQSSADETTPESTSPLQAVMNMMIARAKDTVKVEEVQNLLDEKGFGVSSRYASNTLGKLAEQGHLIRVGRGRYRLNDMNIHATGITPEDYDD